MKSKKTILTLLALAGVSFCFSAWRSSNGNASSAKQEKVLICHKVPGNSGMTIELMVNSSAVAAHLAHGDQIGSCSVKHNYCAECKAAYQSCLDQAGNHQQKIATCDAEFDACAELYCAPAPAEPPTK
jgi:hypothetical protein